MDYRSYRDKLQQQFPDPVLAFEPGEYKARLASVRRVSDPGGRGYRLSVASPRGCGPRSGQAGATHIRHFGAGLDAAAAVIREGVTDHEIARAGSSCMLGAGSEFMSMQPIVTTGARSGIIHTNHAGYEVARRPRRQTEPA